MAEGAELLAIADRIVAQAKPGEQIEAFVAWGRSTQVRAFGGEVEALTSAESTGVGVRVIADTRQGYAHAGSLDPDVVAETLADARDNASFAEPDEWVGLSAPDGVVPIDQDLWRESLVALSPDRKVDLALSLERAVVGRDPRVTRVRTASYGDSAGAAALASTAGMRAEGRSASCWLGVQALADDGDETTTGYSSTAARDLDGLDLDATATEAVERAVRLLGAGAVPSQRLPIVLEPRQASTLLALVGATLTGERVVKGRSPFADRLGESVASPLLTLVDDPTDARSLSADVYDGEGLACRRNVLVEGGRLEQFLHNSYSGRRAGTVSTASAVRGYRSVPGVGCQALSIAPGPTGPDELIAGLGTALVVDTMAGLHSGVNPVSGDFSVGVEGRMIRNGAIAESVRGITAASTLPRLLLGIEAVGSDLTWLPSGNAAATLVIGDVSLSGT